MKHSHSYPHSHLHLHSHCAHWFCSATYVDTKMIVSMTKPAAKVEHDPDYDRAAPDLQTTEGQLFLHMGKFCDEVRLRRCREVTSENVCVRVRACARVCVCRVCVCVCLRPLCYRCLQVSRTVLERVDDSPTQLPALDTPVRRISKIKRAVSFVDPSVRPNLLPAKDARLNLPINIRIQSPPSIASALTEPSPSHNADSLRNLMTHAPGFVCTNLRAAKWTKAWTWSSRTIRCGRVVVRVGERCRGCGYVLWSGDWSHAFTPLDAGRLGDGYPYAHSQSQFQVR